MLVTDGIHDNLDPQHLGILPKCFSLKKKKKNPANPRLTTP